MKVCDTFLHNFSNVSLGLKMVIVIHSKYARHLMKFVMLESLQQGKLSGVKICLCCVSNSREIGSFVALVATGSEKKTRKTK